MQRTGKYQVRTHDQPDGPPRADDPLATLVHQHAVTLGSVRDLDEAARSIREKGFTADAFESIASVASFLDDFFRRHESLEEQYLFPAAAKFDPQQVRLFREEHRRMRSLFSGLLSLVGEIEGGRIHGSSVGDLLRIVGEIVTLLRRHIIHENDVLYPLIREKLSRAEIEQLRKSMPAF